MNRGQMNKLFDMLEPGDVIVTKNFSRFTRNPIAQQILIDNMDSKNIKILYVDKEDEDDTAPSIRAWFEQRWAKQKRDE